MKPVTSEIMAEIDRRAQEEYGISQSVLMDNAGRAVAEEVTEDISSFCRERIAIFCGKGNNGGDGFVIARYLSEKAPKELTVYAPNEDLIRRGSAYDNYVEIRQLGVSIKPIDEFVPSKIEGVTVAIDSVFGTGFKGQLPEELAQIFKAINFKNIKLYAVDVPSGLNATTGEAAENCFRAGKTITFGLKKVGFYQKDGPDVCGEVIVKDIGFPRALLESYQR